MDIIACLRYRNGALFIPDQEGAALSRSAASFVMVCLLPLVAVPAGACSLAGCWTEASKMRSHFAVKIRHADKPLPGATVEITEAARHWRREKVHCNDGQGWYRPHPQPCAGDYWLDAEYLDIGAAYHCFHIKERPPEKQNATWLTIGGT